MAKSLCAHIHTPAAGTYIHIVRYNTIFFETWYSFNDTFSTRANGKCHEPHTNTQFNQMEKFSFIFEARMMMMVCVCAWQLSIFHEKQMKTRTSTTTITKGRRIPKSGTGKFDQFIASFLSAWARVSEWARLYIICIAFVMFMVYYFALILKFNKLLYCSCITEWLRAQHEAHVNIITYIFENHIESITLSSASHINGQLIQMISDTSSGLSLKNTILTHLTP